MSYNITDSSLNWNPSSTASYDKVDTMLKSGIVREVYEGKDGQTMYTVEVLSGANIVLTHCRTMVKFGGPYNYEEVTFRPYKISGINLPKDPLPNTSYKTRAGDMVIVAYLYGLQNGGIILGSLPHPSRTPEISAGNSAYQSSFNGIETKISDTGEYKLTFKGRLLTPLDMHVPGTPIIPPLYDPITGGSYFSMMDDGSIILDDSKTQSFKIDKTGKAITIKSGSTTIELGVFGCKVTAPTVTIESKASTEVKALSISMESKTSVKVKGLKIAIGNSSFELIDGLIKLIDALGTIIVTSPVGPCNPLQSSPMWAQVMAIKTQLTIIKGSL